jgi:hypothetical protein
MSLNAELDAFRSGFIASAPAAIQEAMVRANIELAASGILQRALKATGKTPDFRLPNARGRLVGLTELLGSGPVVLSFYRGAWCSYCSLELRALPEIPTEDFAARRNARRGLPSDSA